MLTKDECHAIAEEVAENYWPAEPKKLSTNTSMESRMALAFHAALADRTCARCKHIEEREHVWNNYPRQFVVCLKGVQFPDHTGERQGFHSGKLACSLFENAEAK